MGSNRHYPEERPVHSASVDGFWIDRHLVTNEEFACFVEATGHVTFAELTPDPADYPGALPEMLYTGSLVFVKPGGPVDRAQIGNWWQYMVRLPAVRLRARAVGRVRGDHPLVLHARIQGQP